MVALVVGTAVEVMGMVVEATATVERRVEASAERCQSNIRYSRTPSKRLTGRR